MATPITTIITKAPGVYVQEVPSGTAPIAGVSTSTAAFIGVFPGTVNLLDTTKPTEITMVSKKAELLAGNTLNEDIILTPPSAKITVPHELDQGDVAKLKQSTLTSITVIETFPISDVENSGSELDGKIVHEDVTYQKGNRAKTIKAGEAISPDDGELIRSALSKASKSNLELRKDLPITVTTSDQELIGQRLALEVPITEVVKSGTLIDDQLAARIVNYADSKKVNVTVKPYKVPTTISFSVAEAEQPFLCTNFGEFKAVFGDFSTDSGQNALAHAVYGFFRNGGSRCYVVRIDTTVTEELEAFGDPQKIEQVLDTLASLDEISIVAAPGITNKNVLQAISGYIETNNYTWVAIFDAPSVIQPNDSTGALDPTSDKSKLPATSDYAALYYPWIQAFDPVTKLQTPKGDGLKLVPPSGHIAGIYARVDTVRGVYKAPANEPVVGAAGLQYSISKVQQGALNQHGVNCIRNLNGTILVWGARTLGGDTNGEFKYINVRRLFNYLRKSIDEGTQWTVFEPNSPELWSRIRRNVNAFLLTVWRTGALFGDTPEQAFYVKCDEETNPPANRDLGVVVIEIGVAVVRPAEFVVFNLSQWAGAGK